MSPADIPSEIAIGGIYFPPILFAIALGTLLAAIIARLLNRFGLTRFIWHPPLFFVALTVLCTRLVTLLLIPV
ncbi:MAG TPA: DUF1656 domain-containing protein [Gammaproteobacteria bacterium]|nr:DUF1656 domain-containing protein [Gammaproteobacteria bacterium]